MANQDKDLGCEDEGEEDDNLTSRKLFENKALTGYFVFGDHN